MPLPTLPFSSDEQPQEPRDTGARRLPRAPIAPPPLNLNYQDQDESQDVVIDLDDNDDYAEDNANELDLTLDLDDTDGEDYAPAPHYTEPSPFTEPAPIVVETDPDAALEYSDSILESIDQLLAAVQADDSTEVLLNGPHEVMFKKSGARYQIPNIDLGDVDTYHRIINEFILSHTDTTERIGKDRYLIEGQMEWYDQPGEPPVLARVHIVAPPVVKHAKVTIAKKSRQSLTIDDIANSGAMTPAMAEFLKAVAAARVTTVFSGLSGAGKTTLLEAMSYNFDANDRIIVVEDTPELRLPISDTVYMTTTASKPGVNPADVVTMDWLVRATNRMRPDRIIVGEIRGGEMGEFLIAANSGADGSMTTVHAANPRMTLEKMRTLAMKSEFAKDERTVAREIASTVQLIVQASLIDGQHIITHIEEVSDTIREQNNVIATQTLFEYDRNTGRHVSKMRPSEKLQNYMAQRGVMVDPSWFVTR